LEAILENNLRLEALKENDIDEIVAAFKAIDNGVKS